MTATPEPFTDYWHITRRRLDAGFTRWIPRFFPQLPESAVDAIAQALADGKRLRGCLLCLVNDALRGRAEAAIPRALAIECIHAASLIHDDLIDGDSLRRGRPATWATIGPRKAVLLGDVIFATALQRMVELSREDGIALAEAIATMAGGAYREPLETADLAGMARGEALYPDIIYLKTGALFGAAARMGALAAGAPVMAAAAFAYGRQLGEAYQIADDLLDLVECPVDASGAPPLAALAPVLLHFCADRCPPLDSAAAPPDDVHIWLKELRPVLRQRMRAAIQARLRGALDAVEAFPVNAYTPLLRAAPADTVGMMLNG